MGQQTYVRVADPIWRFDSAHVVAALRNTYVGTSFQEDGDHRKLTAMGYSDGWEVSISADSTTFVVKAPPRSLMDLVSWVRAFVPQEVALEIFDDQYEFGTAPLLPGVTPEQVRSEFYPHAWRIEQMSSPEPATLEERMRSAKPPHVP